ncbi:CD151 antigen [Aplysia californica]|uniref:Tetraspanin n=1 Tax=Aplysia californica TaxID=6500 RepID=A0ABM0K766_APLCA|nr:CD151 antigen [Aplysia californica]
MKNRREDTGCCSRIFLKSIMVVFNTFFLISGVFFLLVGVGSLLWRHEYVSLLQSPLFPITTYLFLGIGGLVVLMGVLGCLATLREIRGCLLFYAFVLMAVFMLETCAGVLAYMYESAIHEELTRNLNKTMSTQYLVDSEVTRAVDAMQADFQCCGATYYTDWEFSHWAVHKPEGDLNLVPHSCCITPNTTCASLLHPSNIHQEGCIQELEKFLRLHLILIGGVGLGLSVLQIFGVIFSCCFSQKIKEEMDV